MGSVNFEQMLIAGAISNTEISEKIFKARFEPYDFEDVFAGEIFSACIECHKLGNTSLEAVKTYIQSSDIDTNKKGVFIKYLEDANQIELDMGEFGYRKLLNERKERRFRYLLKKTANDLVYSNIDQKKIYDNHKKQLDILLKEHQDLSIDDYYSMYIEREMERDRSKSTVKDVFKFDLTLRHFTKYFPRGIAKQTGTIIEGSTGAGKSVFLANLIYLAAHPKNSLNCLYIYSENRTIEALSRLDAIFLDAEYNSLYNSNLNNQQRSFFASGKDNDGYGKVFALRAPLANFDAAFIENAIEQLAEDGVIIDALFVDSPDHMQPLVDQGVWFQNKGQVYMDLKDLYESKNLIFFGTRPQLESFSKSGELTIQSGAGGQGISRLIDNSIAFNYDPNSDSVSDHRLFTVTKARDGKIDFSRMRYKILPSLRFMHEEDFAAKYGNSFKEEDLFTNDEHGSTSSGTEEP